MHFKQNEVSKFFEIKIFDPKNLFASLQSSQKQLKQAKKT